MITPTPSTDKRRDVYIAVTCHNDENKCYYTVNGRKTDRFEVEEDGVLHFTMTGDEDSDSYAIAIVGSVDGEPGTGRERERGPRCNDSAVAFAVDEPAQLPVRGTESSNNFPITLLCMAKDEDGYYQPSCTDDSKKMMMMRGPRMRVVH